MRGFHIEKKKTKHKAEIKLNQIEFPACAEGLKINISANLFRTVVSTQF